jgi:hypothetical protein
MEAFNPVLVTALTVMCVGALMVHALASMSRARANHLICVLRRRGRPRTVPGSDRRRFPRLVPHQAREAH